MVIGRVAIVDPSEGERYFLKLLLSNVRCPTSYEDLLTVGNRLHDTFRLAALHRGLLESDIYAKNCLEEAAKFQMPSTLRKLFAILLVHCIVPNPKKLLEKFFDVLSDDFSRSCDLTPSEIEKKTLASVDEYLVSMGKSIHDFSLAPNFLRMTEEEKFTRELAYEKNIPISTDDLQSISKLNEKQRIAFNDIIHKIDVNEPGTFFIDGPGGTGKTFLYRALLEYVRSRGHIALVVATSGVAVALLPGGRTAHSRFKLPIDTEERADAKVSKQSSLAKMILIAKLIIWDEASMASRKIIEAFDNLLKDITDKGDALFGGKIVVFGGDFRPTLPVVPRADRAQTLNASFVASDIWPYIKKIKLEENIRARHDPEFTAFLLRIGDGNEPYIFEDNILLPNNILLPFTDRLNSIANLIKCVFPSIDSVLYDAYDLVNRAISTPKNNCMIEINSMLIEKLPGISKQYVSYNKASNPQDQGQYEEFFSTVTTSSLPPHILVLKKNCPVMLLRNLNPVEGLCNGTRLICRVLGENFIQAEIATGDHKGKNVFIPRIPLECSNKDKCPISFKRFNSQ